MECEGEGLKSLSILTLDRFPAPHLRLGGLYLTRGLEGGHRIRLPFLVPLQSVLGFLPLLARPSQLPANGERITFHKVAHEMR